jgi:3-oxoacyl-[acyl-carrier protein] reductase
MNLENKIAIVTGASKGIGLCIAKTLSDNGALVIGTYNNNKTSDFGKVKYYKLDITNYIETEKFTNKIIKKYHHIDILVNNAGITSDGLTKNMTVETFEKVINTNLIGTFNITKLIGPHMQENKSGSIINIASIVGIYGNIGQINYAASKSGIIGMTHTWAKEFAMKDSKVRVNAIAPGYTMTDMLKTVPSELLEKFKNMTLLKRLADPQDIANAALFLSSDLSSYITDEIINVNGGMKL